MNNFEILIKKASNQTRKDILRDVIVFPKTEALEENKPVSIFFYDEKPNWESILVNVNYDEELVAINAVNDINILLGILKEIQDDLHLQQFDSIQIYRGGVNIVRVINRNKNIGRSVYIEINEYRKRLYNYMFPKNKSNNYYGIIATSFISALISAFIVNKIQ